MCLSLQGLENIVNFLILMRFASIKKDVIIKCRRATLALAGVPKRALMSQREKTQRGD